ncbi:MAG: transcriptional regulator GcvA [Alphaproteobacteria bacterium]|nr:transcriptional regulator GcvA [Alphaproteobacteria bacterium]
MVEMRLPPLNALRAFAAAGRHLSFARAAEELHVTPAAISQQIKQLEDQLGLALFRRSRRGVVLTEAGQACLPGLNEGFRILAEAVARTRTAGGSGTLTVSVAPSFAAKWLVPRLDAFRQAEPEIDVRVSASMQLTDFARDDVDLAIRYGSGRYPGLFVERLMTEAVVPVCSKALMKGRNALTSPDRLRFHTLLHDDSPDLDPSCPDWRMWLKAAKIEDIDWRRGIRFNQSSLVLETAVLGRGVGLAKAALAADDLRAGRLVRPFGKAQPVDFAYYLVCPEARADIPKVARFRRWLAEEAKAA